MNDELSELREDKDRQTAELDDAEYKAIREESLDCE